MMTPSPACASLAKRYETLATVADDGIHSYWDPLGKCWTIGWGHTGIDVTGGQVWTLDECEAAFEHDLQKAGNLVLHYVDVQLSQGEFDALTDFVFNEGIGHLASSTLLKLLNAGDYSGAGAEFLKWDYAGGAPNADLEQRRKSELELWNS
jgi:lysozyme